MWLWLSLAPGVFCGAVNAAQADTPTPTLEVGPGDTVSIKVFGQPDMDANLYVGDDGTIKLPLVGAVPVAGLSPSQISSKIEKALADGSFLINPHVSVGLVQSVSQLVSVLGEVRLPGKYQVNSKTTIFELLALSGGTTANSADVIFLIRPDTNGKMTRYPVDLKGFTDGRVAMPTENLRGGDSVLVPRADQFFIYGEVQTSNQYRLEPGMTVIQAIARAGGLTVRGSDRRVDIKRTGPDGHETTFRAKQGDVVKPGDVVHVKESIF